MICFQVFLSPRCSRCSRSAARRCTRFLSPARLRSILRNFAGLLTRPSPRRPCGPSRTLGCSSARFLCPRRPRSNFSARRRHWCGGSRIAVRGVTVSS